MLKENQLKNIDHLINYDVSTIIDPAMRSIIINFQHALELMKTDYYQTQKELNFFKSRNIPTN